MNTNFNKVRREVKRISKGINVRLKNIKTVCTPGCSHCCHQNIPIHAAEELTIMEYVDQNFSSTQRSDLSNRFRAWFAFMNDNTPNLPMLSKKDINEFGNKLIQYKIPCPFLNNEKKCSIYPVRPITCRTFYVKDAPEKCKQTLGRIGEMEGYDIQAMGIADIARAADFMQIRLLPYAVAESLGVQGEIKKAITSEVAFSLINSSIGSTEI